MQTIWKGTVSFGLVSIPVRLYSATEERNVSFRQVHRDDGGRIRYKRVCEQDGEEVPYSDIAKGYEMPDGEVVILDKEDFESLPLPSNRVIDVLQFVPTDQLDPLMMARAYYLSADGGPGAKPYVLLRDALASTGRAAIVKVALRNREQLAALSTRDDVMVLQTMLWPDEVRDAGAVAPDEDVTVREQEVAMAESYIETLTADFDPAAYTDEYRHALEELISSKAGGAPLAAEDGKEPAADSNVVDLMAALRASVEAAKQRRAGGERAGQADAADDEAAAAEETATRRRPAKGSGGAAKRPAATKAGVGKAGAARDGEAAGTKAAPKKAAAAKQTTAKQATPKQATPKQATASSATPRKSAPKKSAPKKASAGAGGRAAATKPSGAPAKRTARKTA